MHCIKLRLCLLLPSLLVFMTNAMIRAVAPEENQAVETPLGLMRFPVLFFFLSIYLKCLTATSFLRLAVRSAGKMLR